jgi:hypothetical protein
MTIRDCRLVAIHAKRVAERCEDLARGSHRQQRIAWDGRDYDVQWSLAFDLDLGRFDIVVACEACPLPATGFPRIRWPPRPPGEPKVQELRRKIIERLGTLPLDDDWPDTLPEDWLTP